MAYIDTSHSTLSSKTVVITFSCRDDSLPVYILTSLNDWEPTLMTKHEDLSSEDDHCFQHTVVVKGGMSSILYKFRIGDSHFLHNDSAPAESDGFGGSNNIFVVPWSSEVPNATPDTASTSSPTDKDKHVVSDAIKNYENLSQSTKSAHPPSTPETSELGQSQALQKEYAAIPGNDNAAGLELPKPDHTVIADSGTPPSKSIQQETSKEPANGTTSTTTPASATPNGLIHLRPEKEIGQVDGVPDESTSEKPTESQNEVLIENTQKRDNKPEPARAEGHQTESTDELEAVSKETEALPEASKQQESEQQKSDSATTDEHETKVHIEDAKDQDNEGLSAPLAQAEIKPSEIQPTVLVSDPDKAQGDEEVVAVAGQIHKPLVAPLEQLTPATNVGGETNVAARETHSKELEKLVVADTEEHGEAPALESKSASGQPTATETDENVAQVFDELRVSPPEKPVTTESKDYMISETEQTTITKPDEPITAKSEEPIFLVSEEPMVSVTAEAPKVEQDDTATALPEQREVETIDQEASTTATTIHTAKAEEIADSATEQEEMETNIRELELLSPSAKLQQESDKLKAHSIQPQSLSAKLQQDADKLEAYRMPLLLFAVAMAIFAVLAVLARWT